VRSAVDDSLPGPSSWNLEGAPDGVVLQLARRMETAWRALPDVQDAPIDSDLKSVDAIAPDGDPNTKVRIENLVFTNPKFRKMHLEVAWGLGGLEVMHVVVYPWASVQAPIYAADLVAFNGRVSLCIADTCPVDKGLSLPEEMVVASAELQKKMMTDQPDIEPRPVPEWSDQILSKQNMVCIGPPKEDFEKQKQAAAFCEYAFELFREYVQFVDAIEIEGNEKNQKYGGSTRDRLSQHVLFCEKQLENDKTRKALERSMGVERTDRYMTQVLFDVTEGTPTEP